jgi:hypothetical protein
MQNASRSASLFRPSLSHAITYVNAPGGRELHDAHPAFAEIGVELRFIESRATPYTQSAVSFQPNLSIMDMLMYRDRDDVARQLNACALVS